MIGELFINGLDAYTTWGINMGDGFIDALTEPLSLKGFVTNESQRMPGKQIAWTGALCLKPRDVTLTFVVEGNTPDVFRQRRNAFLSLLYNSGIITLNVPALGTENYRLFYKGKGSSYGMNLARTACKMSLKFEEINPADRGL